MSMDLTVWSSCEIKLPSALPESALWKKYENEFAYEGSAWQVVVSSENEEAPDQTVLNLLPKAKYVYFVTLEPIGADTNAYRFLESVTRSLAKTCGGVWVDPNGNAHFHNNGVF